MNWVEILSRTSQVSGLISLVLAFSIGIHFQHLLDDGGGRHVGEVVVFVTLAVLVFIGSWYGARQSTKV